MRTGTEVHMVHVFSPLISFPVVPTGADGPSVKIASIGLRRRNPASTPLTGVDVKEQPLKTPMKGMRTIDKKTVKHTLRMTESESERLRQWAEKAGITQAEFVRQKVFGHTPVPMPGNVFWNHMADLYAIHDRVRQEEIKEDLRSLILTIQSESTTPREVTDNGNDKAVAH